MKRIVTTALAAGLVSAVGFTSAGAQEAAAEGEAMMAEPEPMSVQVYGSLRHGIHHHKPDKGNNTTDYGSNHGSRFGIKGSADLGNGLTAGYKVERGIGSDNLSQRFHNVYLSGAFGTATFGRQPSPYYGAASFDGAPHLGGSFDVADKIDGIGWSSNFGGSPFTLSALVSDDNKMGGGDGADILEITGSFTAGPVTFNVGHINGARDAADMTPAGLATTSVMIEGDVEDIEPLDENSDRINDVIRTINEVIDAVDIKKGHKTEANRLGDRTAVTVGGNVAAFNWEVGFESGDKVDKCMMEKTSCDAEVFGIHVGYTIGSGNVFLQAGEKDSDSDKNDADFLLFGYSHDIVPGVNVAAIHRMKETGNTPTVETEDTIVRLKIDF